MSLDRRSVLMLIAASTSLDNDGEVLSSSDDENDEGLMAAIECIAGLEHSGERETIKGFVDFLMTCSDETFQSHLRLSRAVVVEVLVQDYSTSANFGTGNNISPEHHLFIFLWFVSHEARSFLDLQNRFDVALSHIVKIIRSVASYICSVAPKWINWPTEREMLETASRIRRLKKIDGVFGFIDGTHISIDKPKKHGEDYFNRKKTYSLHAQIVSNDANEIIDIFTGYPGSVHDSRVFRCSSLKNKLATIPESLHLLGDSGYPCTPQLITPFRDNGHLTPAETNFNFVLSSARIKAEHTIGLLKGSFRCLFHLKLRSVKTMVKVIKSCAVLHNIRLKTTNALEPSNEEPGGRNDEVLDQPLEAMEEPEEIGAEKRRRLCFQLSRNGNQQCLLPVVQ